MSHKRKNLLDELNKLAPSEAEKLINQYAKSKNKSVPKSLVITYAHDIEKHLDTVTVSCPYCQSTNIIKKYNMVCSDINANHVAKNLQN